MRKVIYILLTLVFTHNVYAQAPLGFNYQGIARQADGTPISGTEIAIRVSIIHGPQGNSEFEEVHFLTTNDFGLFTAIIGQGSGNGTLNKVNWAGGNLWLQIELDPDDSGNFILMGSQQLMSVPYALFAQQSGAGLAPGYGVDINNGTISNVLPDRPITLTGKGDVQVSGTYPNFTIDGTGSVDGDSDASNELQTISKVGNDVSLSKGGGSFIDAVDDADADATNELIESAALVGTNLEIKDAGGTQTVNLASLQDGTGTDAQELALTGNTLSLTNSASVDLSSYLDNTDTQLTEAEVDAYVSNNGYLITEVDGSITNELQTISKSGTTVTLSNGGGNFIDAVDDADADATNELIESATLVGTNLEIKDAGGTQTVNLASLQDGTGTDAQKLTLTGNTLSLTNSTLVDLSGYLDNTDTQLSEAEVDSYVSNNGYLITEVDGSITNELQTISKSGTTVTLSNGGGDFIDAVDDADADATNELIESATLVGTNLEIKDAGGIQTVNLASLQDGTGTDTQELTLTGNTLSLTNSTSVDLSSYVDTNLTETEVDSYVSNNGYLTSETDGSTTNEIQDLQLVGDDLEITNNGSATTIDLSGYLDNTDNQILSVSTPAINPVLRQIDISGPSNSSISFSVADSDDDTSNELQTLSLNGATNNLQLTSGGTISLSPYLDNTDSQNLTNVLGQGADAGNVRITNLADPVDPKDVVNVQYLENKIATDYAFKSIVNDVGTGVALTFDLATFDFDEGSLISTTQVTITEAGVYLFTIKGTSTSNASLVINVNNATDYSVGLINLGKYYDTIFLKLSIGDIVELRANTTGIGEIFVLEFFGYKI